MQWQKSVQMTLQWSAKIWHTFTQLSLKSQLILRFWHLVWHFPPRAEFLLELFIMWVNRAEKIFGQIIIRPDSRWGCIWMQPVQTMSAPTYTTIIRWSMNFVQLTKSTFKYDVNSFQMYVPNGVGAFGSSYKEIDDLDEGWNFFLTSTRWKYLDRETQRCDEENRYVILEKNNFFTFFYLLETQWNILIRLLRRCGRIFK